MFKTLKYFYLNPPITRSLSQPQTSPDSRTPTPPNTRNSTADHKDITIMTGRLTLSPEHGFGHVLAPADVSI